MTDDKSQARTEKALEVVDAALGSGAPGESIFADRDGLKLLGIVRLNDPATYGLIRQRLKWKVNLQDLDRSVKAAVGSDPEQCRAHADRLLEKDGSYIKKRHTQNGPVYDQVSNFVLSVLERLSLPTGEEVIAVEVSLPTGTTMRRDIPHDALLRKEALLHRIGTTKAAWFGTDADVQLLRNHLLKHKAPERDAVEVLGRHTADGRDLILLPNLVLDRDGPSEDAAVRFVDLHENPIKRQLTADGKRQLVWPDRDQHLAAAKAIYRHLPQINAARTVAAIIGWFFSLPWAFPIKRAAMWGGFPHLNPWGGTGHGKTSTIELVLRAMGFPTDVTPLDLPGTRFTRLRAYASSNLFPVYYDEFRLSTWERTERSQFLGELRQAYGGGREERGRADQGANVYELVSPIILAGEDRPRDLALDNRLISIQLRKADKQEEPFRLLSEAQLDAFALPYLSWSLAQENWLDDLNAHRTAVRDWLNAEGFTSVDSRVVNNLAIIRFGYATFERYADHLGLEPAPLLGGSLQDALRGLLRVVMPADKDRNSLDQLMHLLWTMAGNERLGRGKHFAFKGQNLVIPLTEALAEARKYARETSWEEDVLSEDTYRGLIQEMVDQGGSYVLQTSERADFASWSVRKQRRGVLIDPQKLQVDLDLDAGQWGDATAILAIEIPASTGKRGVA